MTDKFESETTPTCNIQVISDPAMAIEDSPMEHSDNITQDVNEASKENKLLESANITIDSADTETVANNEGVLQGK